MYYCWATTTGPSPTNRGENQDYVTDKLVTWAGLAYPCNNTITGHIADSNRYESMVPWWLMVMRCYEDQSSNHGMKERGCSS